MHVTFRGIYTLDEFFQAVWDERPNFDRMGIQRLRSASIYYQPLDSYGDPVTLRYANGDAIDGWTHSGPYPCIAREFGL